MTKHFFIISFIFSMVCLVSSFIDGYELFTILGWFTACISGLTVILLEETKKLNKYDK